MKKENEQVNTGNDNNGGDWIKITNIASVRAGAAAAIYNDSIFIYGGEDYAGVVDDLWRYNINTEYFEELSSNGAIAYTDMVELDGILYIFGGKDAGGNPTQNLKLYNISTNTLDEISGPSGFNGPTPSARYSHISLAYTDSSSGHRIIFVHGGFTDTGDADGKLYKLDLDNVTGSKPTWDDTSNFNIVIGDHSALINNNKIYFFGGYISGTGEYLNQIYIYDIAGDTYSTLNPGTVIPGRSAMKSISTDKGIYIYGGEDASGCLNDLWFYSFSGNNWEKISTGPDKRCHYNILKYSDHLLIYGGYDKNKAGQKVFNSELWQYPIYN